MQLDGYSARHVANDMAKRGDLAPHLVPLIGAAVVAEAAREIGAWPGYAPTPLRQLAGLARALDLRHVLYKDEAPRFGLGSFKALGGAYAVLRVLQRELLATDGHAPPGQEIMAGRWRGRVSGLTVTTATDGNHGRSVAWGAERFGCRCVVYIHAGVSQARERSIAAYGAEMRRVPGGYDDSVHACAADAAREGWHLVADTSVEGGPEVPALVMQGYALLATEVLDQLAAVGLPALDHAFVPAGVGGLAAAVAGVMADRLGQARPRLVVVEPEQADCVFRTVAAGRPARVPGEADSFMACLSAAEVSPLAWDVLATTADDVLALPEAAAPAAMRLLAAGVGGDAEIVAGESGCAAVAALIAAARDPGLRGKVGLAAGSTVLVVGSEGATDPVTWAATVGRPVPAAA